MKLLFIGDIVGKVGRHMVKQNLPSLKALHQIDIVILNGENAAHGKGITPKIYQEFIMMGVDCITLGNHAFSKKEIIEYIDTCDRLIRPKNMIPEHLGKSTLVLSTQEGKLAVHNLSGQVFMNNITTSPIECFNQMLEDVEADMHFVDFHAEATAEKLSFFHEFKEQCIGIVGTHTHVMTADSKVESECGYISDVGMCGAYHSILGRSIDEVLSNMKGEKTRYTVANGPGQLNAVVLTIENKKCVHILPIQIFENDY